MATQILFSQRCSARAGIPAVVMLIVVAMVGVYSVHEYASGQDKGAVEKVPAAQIEQLVKQLGSNNAKTREAATKALVTIGEKALPFLKAGFRDPDLEIRRRAEALHAQISELARAARMKAKVQKATKYGIDVLVGRIVRKGKDASDEDWLVLTEIVENLRGEAKAKCSSLPDHRPAAEQFLKRPLEVTADFKEGQFSGVRTLRLILK